MSKAEFRCRTRYMSGSRTTTCSRSAARSTSKARDRCTPGISWEGATATALQTRNSSRSAVRQFSRLEPLGQRAKAPQRLAIARPCGKVGYPVRQYCTGPADGELLHLDAAAIGNIAEPQDDSGAT